VDTEFVVLTPCGKRVTDRNGKLLGFCERPKNHTNHCTHLLGKTIRHNLRKRDGQTSYDEEHTP
jgi:hypothetical protein